MLYWCRLRFSRMCISNIFLLSVHLMSCYFVWYQLLLTKFWEFVDFLWICFLFAPLYQLKILTLFFLLLPFLLSLTFPTLSSIVCVSFLSSFTCLFLFLLIFYSSFTKNIYFVIMKCLWMLEVHCSAYKFPPGWYDEWYHEFFSSNIWGCRTP